MEETRSKQTRKPYAKRGESTQKMYSFKMDSENREWMSQQGYGGRWLNNLIENERKSPEGESPRGKD